MSMKALQIAGKKGADGRNLRVEHMIAGQQMQRRATFARKAQRMFIKYDLIIPAMHDFYVR